MFIVSAPFGDVLETLAGAVRQKQEIKLMPVGKDVKLSLFADGLILYTGDPKTPPENF